MLKLACTAGAGSDTWLYLDDLEVTCADDVSYTIDPSAGPGQLGGQAPGLFQAAVYQGVEEFDAFDKCYWNVAIGMRRPAFGNSCTLTVRGTASGTELVGGALPADETRPFIAWSVPLTNASGAKACGVHAVDQGVAVRTQYAQGAPAFDHGLRCGGPPSPPPAPRVSGVTPSGADPGQDVHILGSGFGASAGTVTFGGDRVATIVDWTPTDITVTVPTGGISGEVAVVTAGGVGATGETYFGYTNIDPAPIATLNSTAYSIFDLDFDGLGNAYYAEFISGTDRMHRVAPSGVKTSYVGIADYNLGFGAASWDGTQVSGSYSGTTPKGVLLVDGANVMQYLYAVTVTTCTTWNISGYRLCGPMDPEWGYDGFFYAGNLTASGVVARYNQTTAPDVIVTLPAFVVSVATLQSGRLWAAAGKVLYSVDKVARTFSEVATFAHDIVSISASQYHRRVYVETTASTTGPDTIWSVDYTTGDVTSLISAGLATPAFITVGPDFRLYRIQGRVDAFSTITSYDLPAP